MGGKKEKLDVIDSIFCDRCGTLYQKICVDENVIYPMCPICHKELFDYFIDDNRKFIHFGNDELFTEIAEKVEAATDRLGFIKKEALRKRYGSITYTDFIITIRERAKKMLLIESRFKPKTLIKLRD